MSERPLRFDHGLRRYCSLLLAVIVMAAGGPGVAFGEDNELRADTPSSSPSAAADTVSTLLLVAGQVHTLPVEGIDRVVIGNPDIVDLTVASSDQLLIQAKRAGATNLIIWDQRGVRESVVTVIDPQPEAIERELAELLRHMDAPLVTVQRRDERLFLMGTVSSDAQLQSIEQMISPFQGRVINLVAVTAPPPAPAPRLVKLTVQVVDVSRTDLEKLGVNWSQSFTLTEPSVTDMRLSDAFMRWGTSVTRSSVAAALNALVTQNKAKILAEPKLVTGSGVEASSFIGVEVPVLQATTASTSSSTVSTTIDFKKTGVLLKITPTVRDDDEITTRVHAEVSDVDTASGLNIPVGSNVVLVPGFKVREASTEVTIRSGEPLIMAGLLKTENTESVSQVPALGSFPVFGRLFRSPEKQLVEREMVITVTPVLLDKAVAASAPATTRAATEIPTEGEAGEPPMAEPEAVQLPAAGFPEGGAAPWELAPEEPQERRVDIADVRPDVTDPRLRYALEVQDRLAAALTDPARAPVAASGTVRLRLHLLRDGTLQEAVLAQPSGNEAVDQDALAIASREAPYPAFPPTLPGADLWLEIPVSFEP